jgi:GrpB-like predicted nucleotidyltransferase (UPF0157 family)
LQVPISVIDYDPEWPRRFERVKAVLAEHLVSSGVPFVAIEHVGSTSVPGLAAKPSIDCDIIVDAASVERASTAVVALGFAPLGELGIPERWAFKSPEEFADIYLYVVIDGSLSLRNHMAVRELLRSDAVLRDEYAAVKKRVAATAADIDEYGQGKAEIVQRILAAAGLTDEERQSIASNQVPSHTEVPR